MNSEVETQPWPVRKRIRCGNWCTFERPKVRRHRNKSPFYFHISVGTMCYAEE